MDQIVVLKFGGSSVADNVKLNIVAQKIIDIYNNGKKVVVVLSAQGKTTDKLINEAKEITSIPDDREMDVLLSTGEQITISKLSILLKSLGYKSISLTGWQAGIHTTNLNQDARIQNIDIKRIKKELNDDNIVIIAGFQGINENNDITTLGRGGSDTTAVAVAAAINASECYIFSDVDGVYTTDPNKLSIAKKLEKVSYEEMLEISNEGAKVLQNRCIEIAQKYKLPIITKSTFNNMPGTIVDDNIIEDTCVKSIVKNDDIIYINIKYEHYTLELLNKIFNILLKYNININHFTNNSLYNMDIKFSIKINEFNKFQNLLDKDLNCFEVYYTNISRISVIGYGIMNNNSNIEKIFDIIELNNLNIISLDITESKISIMLSEKASNNILEQFHKALIK